MASHEGLVKYFDDKVPALVVIATALTPHFRAELQKGVFDAVISQDSGHIVRSAVRLMRATIDAVPYNQLQARIRTEIFRKEN
ncbi:MAG: hypothetical protein KTR32_23660 [Granulosicoccus sp.]|nr:hypothetical protein [Granulosicoccus sp.]